MIVREIHFLLLTGPNGPALRSIHTLGSPSNQIARAIVWLKRNLAAAVGVEELAGKVHMAPSTFHRHFKEVTGLSPIQYQKRLRLHEAQRLMLVQDLDAGRASAAVGTKASASSTGNTNGCSASRPAATSPACGGKRRSPPASRAGHARRAARF